MFRNGENALQVLPPLVDVIPEARLNLVIYYLKNDDVMEAYDLIRDVEPSTPQEYILKAVVNATLGQVVVTPRLLLSTELCNVTLTPIPNILLHSFIVPFFLLPLILLPPSILQL